VSAFGQKWTLWLSANINTELGVIIRSPELAEQSAKLIKAALADHTYEVFLNEKGKLRWRGLENGFPPTSGFAARIRGRFD